MDILKLITTIGGAASAIMVIIGLPWSIRITIRNNKNLKREIKENTDSHIKDIVSGILDEHTNEVKGALTPLNDGLQSVLRSDLRLNGNKYIDRYENTGEGLSAEEWIEYQKMFEAYRALGGNSFIVDIYKNVEDIPCKYR